MSPLGWVACPGPRLGGEEGRSADILWSGGWLHRDSLPLGLGLPDL